MKEIASRIAAVLSLIAAPASAADMATKAPPPPVAYSWTGFYFGGNAGYSWGYSGADTVQGPAVAGQYATGPCDPGGVATGCSFSTNSSPGGPIGGIQAGYNYQAGVIVYGIEADFDFRHASDSARFVFNSFFDNQLNTSTENWVGTVRGRIGYVVAPNWLAYVSGGLAYGDLAHSVTQTFCLTMTNCRAARGISDDVTNVGWVAGAGVDYAFSSNWSIGIEYLYIGYEADTVSTGAATVGPTLYPAVNVAFHDSSQVLRARLNFKFN